MDQKYWICLQQDCFLGSRILNKTNVNNHTNHQYQEIDVLQESLKNQRVSDYLVNQINYHNQLLNNFTKLSDTTTQLQTLIRQAIMDLKLHLVRRWDIYEAVKEIEYNNPLKINGRGLEQLISLINNHKMETSNYENQLSELNSKISDLIQSTRTLYKDMADLSISKIAPKINGSPKKPVDIKEKIFEKNLKGHKDFNDFILGKELSFESNYTKVILNLSQCNVTSLKETAAVLPQQTNLIELQINLRQTQFQSIQKLCEGIQKLQNLQILNLNLRQTNINSTKEVGEALKQLPKLEKVFLSFARTKINDLKEVGEALKQLPDLQEFGLGISKSKCNDIYDVLNSIENCRQLKNLHLALSSTSFSGFKELSQTIGKLTSLEQLELDLSQVSMNSIKGLSSNIEKLYQLKKLELNVSKTKISEIGELGQSLFTLNKLEELNLDLSDTQVQTKLRKVFISRYEFLSEIGYKV